MAFLVTLAILGIIAFVLWKNKAQVKALVDSFKPPQTPPAAPSMEAKAPPMGAIQASMGLDGSGGNGTPSNTGYNPKSQWRTDRVIDTQGYWKVPAGKTDYSVSADPGSVVRFLIGPADEGMGNGSVVARGLNQAIQNGYGNISFQALDPVTTLTVECDKPVLLQRV